MLIFTTCFAILLLNIISFVLDLVWNFRCFIGYWFGFENWTYLYKSLMLSLKPLYRCSQIVVKHSLPLCIYYPISTISSQCWYKFCHFLYRFRFISFCTVFLAILSSHAFMIILKLLHILFICLHLFSF